jgi:D-serine deaminase-like pyridoxal phosphate-dependent protein
MNSLYSVYSKALKDVPSPALYLDVGAFEKNMDWALQNHGEKKLRVATKSIRSVELIRRVLNYSPIFQGLMSFTLEESFWLHDQGFRDILMGYPTTDIPNLKRLAQEKADIVLMIDSPAHVNWLSKIADETSGSFKVCVDLDLSLDLPGVRFGVYRSSITETKQLDELLTALKKASRLTLVGAMGYEAQIAGVMDKESWLMKFLKKISLPRLKKRRQQMIELIHERGFKLDFVNGGGTGSLKETIKEHVVTEVTVGSAFFAPVLFDHYQDFTLHPAMGFTLPVVRKPKEGMVTCLGGGYIASGATELIKTPTPYLPEGLKLIKNEGAGEVQTPVIVPSSVILEIGDVIFMRHAKAGEACERFKAVHLIQNGEYKGSVPTYRGDGQTFL